MVNLNLLVVIPHQCPHMKVLITHRYANWTGVHSSPEPRSVCTPNHVPKSLASAKVSNFKMFQTHIQFANPCLLSLPFPLSLSSLPVVAASVVRRQAAAAAAVLGVVLGKRVAGADTCAAVAVVASQTNQASPEAVAFRTGP